MESTRLIRDSLVNYTGTLVSGAVAILLVPILIEGLGTEVYGLWIAALAIVGLFMSVDLGLEWSLPREIAAEECSDRQNFVVTAANLYLLIGIAGAAVIAIIGVTLAGNLHLSVQNEKTGPIAFVLAGMIFLTNQPLKFANAVLVGLRRFDISNGLVIASTVIRAAGIIVLLKASAGLAAVASWHVITNTLAAWVALWMVGKLDARYRFRPGQLSLASLRGQIGFSLTSQLIAGVTRILWESPPLLIGLLRGSSLIVPYHIGQRFPFAVSIIHDRAGNVIFPAASQNARDPEATKQLLISGMRWILALAFPLCLLLWIFAPLILRAWLGTASTETVAVMRLTTIAVLFDALGAGSLHLLWGRGSAATVLCILTGMAIASLAIGLPLLNKIGIVGMAWGLLIPMMFGALLLLYQGARAASLSLPDLLGEIFHRRIASRS